MSEVGCGSGGAVKLKPRILIVDDDLEIGDLLKVVLQEEGYAVEFAASAVEGLSLLQRETFHLVVLDLKMPGMDGVEALGRIIGEQRGLPVIIHSSSVSHKDNYLTWSAADFVVKTGDLSVLKESIARILIDNK